jgi:hypothetical protein
LFKKYIIQCFLQIIKNKHRGNFMTDLKSRDYLAAFAQNGAFTTVMTCALRTDSGPARRLGWVALAFFATLLGRSSPLEAKEPMIDEGRIVHILPLRRHFGYALTHTIDALFLVGIFSPKKLFDRVPMTYWLAGVGTGILWGATRFVDICRGDKYIPRALSLEWLEKKNS